jgi:hypothetical protein
MFLFCSIPYLRSPGDRKLAWLAALRTSSWSFLIGAANAGEFLVWKPVTWEFRKQTTPTRQCRANEAPPGGKTEMEGLSGGGVIGAGCQPHRIIVQTRVDRSADPAIRAWLNILQALQKRKCWAAGSMSALPRRTDITERGHQVRKCHEETSRTAPNGR